MNENLIQHEGPKTVHRADQSAVNPDRQQSKTFENSKPRKNPQYPKMGAFRGVVSLSFRSAELVRRLCGVSSAPKFGVLGGKIWTWRALRPA